MFSKQTPLQIDEIVEIAVDLKKKSKIQKKSVEISIFFGTLQWLGWPSFEKVLDSKKVCK